MRVSWFVAAIAVLAAVDTASAQSPVTTPEMYYMNQPNAVPWSGGGYDARLGYWVHGGLSDESGGQWAVRAYTPVTVDGYWLSQPPNTGYVMSGGNASYPLSGTTSTQGCSTSRRHPCRR